jgi:hypothetical protein
VKTDLIGYLYQSDRPADPEAGQAYLRPAHEQVFLVCDQISRQQILLEKYIKVFVLTILRTDSMLRGDWGPQP